MMLTRIGVLMIVVLTATGVNAQVIEIQPFAGVRFGGGFTVRGSVPGGDRDVAINFEPGLTWGATFGFFLGDLAEVEFLWSRQESAIAAAPTAASKTTLFDVSMSQYHGNLLFHFFPRDSRMRPYISYRSRRNQGGSRRRGSRGHDAVFTRSRCRLEGVHERPRGRTNSVPVCADLCLRAAGAVVRRLLLLSSRRSGGLCQTGRDFCGADVQVLTRTALLRIFLERD